MARQTDCIGLARPTNGIFRYVATLVIAVALALPAHSEPVAATDLAGRRVLILGDSITNDGRYVSFLSYYLMKNHPDLNFDMVSIGLSSETASGLSEEGHPFPRPCVHERLARALAMVKPAVVIACYGMNDGIYHPASPERDAAYRDGISKLVTDCHAAGVERVVLLTPGVFDPRPFGSKASRTEGPWAYFRPYTDYDEVLAGYSRWMMGLNLPQVDTVDLHTPMAEYLARGVAADPKFRLSQDGIHPLPPGHLLMAHTILRAFVEAVPDGGLAEELARVEAEPLFALVDRHRRLRSDGWLAYVGYTRGKTVKTDSIAETERNAAALTAQIEAIRRGADALPAAGLLVDLDAERGLELEDGNRVAAWRNQAPGTALREFRKQDQGRAEPGSGRPTLRPAVQALGGRSVLVFERQELVSSEEDSTDGLATGNGHTWLAVMAVHPQHSGLKDVNSFWGNLKNGGKYEGIWGCVTDDNRIWWGARNGITFGRFDANNPQVLGPQLEVGRFYVIGGRMAAGTGTVQLELFVDTATPVATADFPVTAGANASKLAIGQERDAVNHPGHESFDGEIARFLIWQRPLTDAELAAAIAQLKQNYLSH